jgi:hypothetical protein
VWDIVGRVLCSPALRDAFVRRLAPSLQRRFGPRCANIMFPIPVLTRADAPHNSVATLRLPPRSLAQLRALCVHHGSPAIRRQSNGFLASVGSGQNIRRE